jgi:hypothetical protein
MNCHARDVASSPADKRTTSLISDLGPIEDSINWRFQTLDKWPHPIARQADVEDSEPRETTPNPVSRVRTPSVPGQSLEANIVLALVERSEISHTLMDLSSLQLANKRRGPWEGGETISLEICTPKIDPSCPRKMWCTWAILLSARPFAHDHTMISPKAVPAAIRMCSFVSQRRCAE